MFLARHKDGCLYLYYPERYDEVDDEQDGAYNAAGIFGQILSLDHDMNDTEGVMEDIEAGKNYDWQDWHVYQIFLDALGEDNINKNLAKCGWSQDRIDTAAAARTAYLEKRQQ